MNIAVHVEFEKSMVGVGETYLYAIIKDVELASTNREKFGPHTVID